MTAGLPLCPGSNQIAHDRAHDQPYQGPHRGAYGIDRGPACLFHCPLASPLVLNHPTLCYASPLVPDADPIADHPPLAVANTAAHPPALDRAYQGAHRTTDDYPHQVVLFSVKG